MTDIQDLTAPGAVSFADPRVWPDRREASDSYTGEIARHGKHRVILCRDGIQWIIQQQCGLLCGSPRWKSLHYCATKKAILRLWHASEPLSGSVPALNALPDHAHQMRRVVS